MLIKFFRSGQGNGSAPINYLIASHVKEYDGNRHLIFGADNKPKMKVRDPLPDIVRGNIDVTRSLIDQCRHKWRYRSGVISFAASDMPTYDQQIEVINEFEQLAFAGLHADQYNILWVRHQHEGRVELHFLTPRCELTTGKSLNIAPPGYRKTCDTLRDLKNLQYGWADPCDSSRMQSAIAPKREMVERARSRDQLQIWIEELISIGEISDRKEMVAILKKTGFLIPRQGKQYITVQDPETDTRWRMRGAIYDENWTRQSFVEQKDHGSNARDREIQQHQIDSVVLATEQFVNDTISKLKDAKLTISDDIRQIREFSKRARNAERDVATIERKAYQERSKRLFYMILLCIPTWAMVTLLAVMLWSPGTILQPGNYIMIDMQNHTFQKCESVDGGSLCTNLE
nr:relaxase/mobilization nuclease domain-containing protein [uncultured Cohaesibacter sp.]